MLSVYFLETISSEEENRALKNDSSLKSLAVWTAMKYMEKHSLWRGLWK